MRQAPERVCKLALLSTSAQPASPEQAAVYEGLLAKARQGNAATGLGEALISVLHPTHQPDAALQAVNRHMGAAIGVAGLARQVAAVLARVDSRPSLAALAIPTLVLVGEQDQLTPPNSKFGEMLIAAKTSDSYHLSAPA